MADAEVHPTNIVGHVVDAVGCGLAKLLVGEVMHVHRFGFALRPPLAPAVKHPTSSFFLVSTEITADDIASKDDRRYRCRPEVPGFSRPSGPFRVAALHRLHQRLQGRQILNDINQDQLDRPGPLPAPRPPQKADDPSRRDTKQAPRTDI